jgi:hypothetical protein
LVSGAWSQSLKNLGFFDALLNGGAARVPLKARTVVVAATAEGSEVAEGDPKPLSELGLTAK